MAPATATYQPRAAERGVLHTVIRRHLETFLGEAASRADGAGLPELVEQEFREFLTCGVLAHGFARVRCDTCTFERLVPFSCCLETDSMRRGRSPSTLHRRPATRRSAAWSRRCASGFCGDPGGAGSGRTDALVEESSVLAGINERVGAGAGGARAPG